MRSGRLVGPGLALLLSCTLSLAACNSSSQKASGGGNNVTGAETPKTTTKATGKTSLFEALSGKANGSQ